MSRLAADCAARAFPKGVTNSGSGTPGLYHHGVPSATLTRGVCSSTTLQSTVSGARVLARMKAQTAVLPHLHGEGLESSA